MRLISIGVPPVSTLEDSELGAVGGAPGLVVEAAIVTGTCAVDTSTLARQEEGNKRFINVQKIYRCYHEHLLAHVCCSILKLENMLLNKYRNFRNFTESEKRGTIINSIHSTSLHIHLNTSHFDKV